MFLDALNRSSGRGGSNSRSLRLSPAHSARSNGFTLNSAHSASGPSGIGTVRKSERSSHGARSTSQMHQKTRWASCGNSARLRGFCGPKTQQRASQLSPSAMSATPSDFSAGNTNRLCRSSSPLFTKCSESKQNSTYSPRSASQYRQDIQP
jgi:hypothetical protein